MVATDQRMGHGKVGILTPSQRGRKFEPDLLAIGLSADDNKLGFHKSGSDFLKKVWVERVTRGV